jgi:hypothetical protein
MTPTTCRFYYVLTAKVVASFAKARRIIVEEKSSQDRQGDWRTTRVITLTGFPPRMADSIKADLDVVQGLPTQADIESAVKQATEDHIESLGAL